MKPVTRFIHGDVKLMGIIGREIGYTRSPAMHNYAAYLQGRDCVYVPFDCPDEQTVEQLLGSLWQLGCVGLNVTTPYKTLVAKLVESGTCTSVNTVYRGDSGWLGASTDGEGYCAGLHHIHKSLSDFDELVVLGNGGAIEGILAHIAGVDEQSLNSVRVVRRNETRDPALKKIKGGWDWHFYDFDLEGLKASLESASERTLLLQGTSAPHLGDDLKDFVPALDGFSGVVSDIVYGKPSALYFAAIARDLIAQDGESMLIEQARASQKFWWGKAATYEDMKLALRDKVTSVK